jgi:phospholipid/cholesterol/gamma-HCH transport system substrate-binding protein
MRISIENKARLAFIALALLGTVAALGWYFVAAGRFVTYQLSTQDSVSGLIVDAPVEFHGVEVGRVKRVELTASHSVSILLDIKRQAPAMSTWHLKTLTRMLTLCWSRRASLIRSCAAHRRVPSTWTR